MVISVQFFRKMRINVPKDLTISLLAIYSKVVSSYHRDTCSNMFIVDQVILPEILSNLAVPQKKKNKMSWVYTIEME